MDNLFNTHGVTFRGERSRQNAQYLDDEYVIFEVNPQTTSTDVPYKVTDYGFCLCTKGTFRGTINLVPYELRPNMLAVNVPGQYVANSSTTDDFEGICVVMSPTFIARMGLPSDFNIVKSLSRNYVVPMDEGMVDGLRNYFAMVRRILASTHRYRKEMLSHLTCAYLYGLCFCLDRMEKIKSPSTDEQIMARFMECVQQNFRTERKVSFYADQLCLTPSYLSAVVSKVSSRTPTEWIENFVVMEAQTLLRSSNMTIQQISASLRFPSQSFFGKYFKRIVGVSPKEYRGK